MSSNVREVLSIAVIAGVGTFAAQASPKAWQPLINGITAFVFIMALYPNARQRRPVPLAYWLADGDRLVLSRYVMTALGLAILFGTLSGFLLYS